MAQGQFREYLGDQWVHVGLIADLPEHLANLHSIKRAHAVLTGKGVVGYLSHGATSVFIWPDGAKWKGTIQCKQQIVTLDDWANKSEYDQAKAKYEQAKKKFAEDEAAYKQQDREYNRALQYNKGDNPPKRPQYPQHPRPAFTFKWKFGGGITASTSKIVDSNSLRASLMNSVQWPTYYQEPNKVDFRQRHKIDVKYQYQTWDSPGTYPSPRLELPVLRLLRTGCGDFSCPDGQVFQEISSEDGSGVLLDRRPLQLPTGTVNPQLAKWWVVSYDGETFENMPHGRGCEKCRDNTHFEGCFWKGKRHGWGILTLLDGQKVMQEYHSGELKTTEKMDAESQKHFTEVRLHELSRQGDMIGKLEDKVKRTEEALALEEKLHRELLVKYRYDTGESLEARTSTELHSFQQKLMTLLGECAAALGKVTSSEAAAAAAKQYSEGLQAVKVAHEKKMLEFQAEMDLQVERLKRRHSEQVALLETKAAEEQKRLAEMYQNEQKEKETLTGELAQMSLRHKERLEKLREEQAAEMAALAEKQKKEASARKEYYCPITCDVMKDPVVASDGFTYDRDAIENWFKRSTLSPMTGAVLTDLEVRANFTLRSAIREWEEQTSKGE